MNNLVEHFIVAVAYFVVKWKQGYSWLGIPVLLCLSFGINNCRGAHALLNSDSLMRKEAN